MRRREIVLAVAAAIAYIVWNNKQQAARAAAAPAPVTPANQTGTAEYIARTLYAGTL